MERVDVKVLDRRKMIEVNGILFLALILSIVGCALLGPVQIDLSRAVKNLFSSDSNAEILLRTRLPRVLLGAAIGGGMAACGVVLQALLRNPLACPQMLGVSAGASLGGILGLIFLPNWLLLLGGGLLGEISWVPLAAFLGALLSMALVYHFSLFHGRLHPYHLLLTGVIFNAFIAAIMTFVNSIVDFYQAQGLLFWLLGSLSTRAYSTVAFIWIYVLLGFFWLWSKGVSLNLITLGEDSALQLGVEIGALQRQVFVASSLMIGAMVSVSGMIGPNGSGKTTLLKILAAVLVGAGEVKINDKDIRSYNRRELSRLLAVVPQDNQVNFPYSAAEIVLMGRAALHGPFSLEGKRDLEVAKQSMQLTETLSFADRYLHELSGGEKQCVIIARALAQEPQILLLDEPSAFLDLRHQVQILELLRRLNREQGLTIIAALHDLNLAALFFPRLLMLRAGKIYRDGTPRDVLTEQTIEEVYGIRVQVQTDLSGERPQVIICPSM